MSTGGDSGRIHPVPTRRSGYRYLFYEKHHGRGDRDAARWLPSLTDSEEFHVFDEADRNEISDEQGRLYGVRPRDADGDIPDLGTRRQQVAEFPFAKPPTPWHGYPLWPLIDAGPTNRRGEKNRPSKEVFEKLARAGMLTGKEWKRLYKGDHL